MTEKPNYTLRNEKPPECPNCAYWGITPDQYPIWGTTFWWVCDQCEHRWKTRISCEEATVFISNGEKFHTSETCAGSAEERPFLETIKHREPCGNCVPRTYIECYEEYS